MNKNFIEIKNVSKYFGNVKAVDDVSFSISQGEFFSLLGPSGCGKTTLLRLLAGFEHPTKGQVFIDGSDVTSVAPNLRPTNMVFQNYAIFPHLNVRKNIEFGMRKENLFLFWARELFFLIVLFSVTVSSNFSLAASSFQLVPDFFFIVLRVIFER